MTTLPAGPELDRLIAEKVMGWDSYPALTGMASARRAILNGIPVMEAHPSCGTVEFHPSTNIAHAMEVVTELEKSGLELGLCRFIDSYWEANFSIAERDGVSAKGETAQLAICRAALRCVP